MAYHAQLPSVVARPSMPMASAVGAATPAAEAAELADVAEHPASSIPPASMTPPIARAAANRVRLVRADRRFKLSVFHMPV